MQNFLKTLTSECKNAALPEEFNFFGKLIGSWKIDYIDNSNSRSIKGEWHFSWVLDGMAIQDVIILPDYEYGNGRSASIIPVRVPGILPIVIQEKLCGLRREKKTV